MNPKSEEWHMQSKYFIKQFHNTKLSTYKVNKVTILRVPR